jgi:hypothetical protein
MLLNLEGAGAGGRATLFRSNDSAVTRFYQKGKRPFGTAMSNDGWKLGLVRFVFHQELAFNFELIGLCRSGVIQTIHSFTGISV